MNRVVITGIGAITPLGLTLEESWESLLSGKSGADLTTRVPNINKYTCNFSCQVKGFDPQEYMDPKDARRMTEASQYAVAAARMAYEDAALGMTEIDASRSGVVIGTAAGGSIAETERAMRNLLADKKISPILFNSIWPNMAGFAVARAFGFTGYNVTIVTACASGTQALVTAADAIRQGYTDLILAGGTEAFNGEIVMAGYSSMRVLSQRRDEPQKACRPFDKDRDGLVPGEGSAMLVLESLAHAKARNAHLYAEILGYNVSSDARHETEPTPETQAQTMRRALASAGLAPEDIDYINPHATSTPLGDVIETQAIKLAFGERAYQIPVSATKSMTGHMIGAAGAFEASVCALSIRDGRIHPTINYETPDPECDLDYVPNRPRQIPVKVALSNSFGFGGQNASIVLGQITST
ncbi:MAG: beta-ketoacyl-[acyl-carrier-protein] synthase II [Chloroflexi bacterium RBG_16_57_11]|nr:MAG: beta-ketoacyl-[acyl-carrier-protein] synthase II [Chloroflexi bacterium RBG_16_57_11]